MKPKTCKTCKQIKPIMEFAKNKNCADGHLTECKQCNKIYRQNNALHRATIERNRRRQLGVSPKKIYTTEEERKKAHTKSVEKWKNKNKKVYDEYLINYRKTHKKQILQQRYKQYKNDPAYALVDRARQRSKKYNVPFNISVNYVRSLLVDVCPVLDIPLLVGKGVQTDNSPSLDRIIPEKGYIVGNVLVVSLLANKIKTNATPEQIIKVGTFYKKVNQSSLI